MYQLRFVTKGRAIDHGRGALDALKAKAQDMSPRSGDGEGVAIPLVWQGYRGGWAADVRLVNGAIDGFWHIYQV